MRLNDPKRHALMLAVASCLPGCMHRPDYVAQFAHHEAVPNGADFKELPRRTRPPGERVYEFYRGLCRDHGFISTETDDRAATERAIDTHNNRYHRGEPRAAVLTTMMTP